ncbi:MAG: hypothetical protein ACREDL_14700 [Bradyrhizobium sp.]
MRRTSILISALASVLLAANPASAQTMIPPGWSQFNPPPPPSPPPPKIEAPQVPQMDAPLRYNYVRRRPPPSFGDRIVRCLGDAAAAGLGPADRAAYSRACANR